MRKLMKKQLIMITALIMIFVLAACGSAEVDEYAQKYEGHGEVIDTGVIKGVCPTGWNSVDAYDLTKSSSEPLENALLFVKSGTGVDEDRPYIKIVYHKANEEYEHPSAADYDNALTIDSISTGSYVFEGFTAWSAGQQFVVLEAEAEKGTIDVWLWMHSGEEVSAAPTESDVLMILDSLVIL